ncbi:hypothetical protein KVR01_005580 [Diaporthe batatas]|uniref:uncharacterized protein n=1 Tax=Diaporthe batatas TaxID=748121 RepID=UPI001D05215F|nr:uncharacterized protein KVR01_005580 [Diaporthe batatas]KAG8165305.1 hypothetical protein KVR01_005580 [Diaporthe batatas]
MCPSAPETVESIQAALEPYVRTREEVSHIRRVLALHLLSAYENGPQPGSLALPGPDCIINSTAGVRGIQRDYLKALHANIKAKQDQEVVRQAVQEGRSSTTRGISTANRLEEHVTSIKLERKQARLQAVERYMEALGRKPAAAPEFVRPEEIFKDGHRLPDVPKTVVSGFSVNNGPAKPDLKALVDRLEKAVLRSKLLLKKEEQLLEDVRSRSTATRDTITDSSKLAALSATRNELISWMEAELSKASHLDETEHNEPGGKQQPTADRVHVNEQLSVVKGKYAKYVAARKALIELVQQRTKPVEMESPSRTTSGAQPEVARTTPATHLITPYIEGLVQVGQAQRNYIAQKSHINTVFARQTEETIRALDRLSEESQLIPEHSIPAAARGRTGLETGSSSNHVDRVSERVQPWVSAADTAKLATLEAVAEKIEQGQVALEKSTRSLGEIDQLLGRNTITGGEPMTDEDTTIDDIWLAESSSPRKVPTSKAFTKNKSNLVKEKEDIWSTLDGSVGLINAEDSPRKLL